MPFHNHWELTHARLFELYRHVPPDCKFILVNDASTDVDCEQGVGWWQNNMKRSILYYKNETNLGFGGSMNIGAKLALKYGADVLVFLSNDVIIRGDFVAQINEKLAKDASVLIGGEVIYYPAGWNEFEFDGKKFIVPYVNGWLLACTADVWKNLVGFDPIYGKYTFEDIDISMKAQSLGYKLVGLNSPYLSHIGGGTIGYTPERDKITTENRNKFIGKWEKHFDSIFQTLEAKNDANKKAN